jgi:2-dehydro-3-deoxyphosphooctonate aldolase (KDO 8-P synthase)
MTTPKNVAISDKVAFNNQKSFVLISGPCQIESKEHAMGIAQRLVDLTDTLDIPFIFKSSYDKANRTSVAGARGIGMEKGLEILAEIKQKLGCPVLTDVHAPEQCAVAAKYVDVLQVPAFLSRQTDMLLAAGKTGKPIHVKKGQFLAPWDMANVAKKIASTGNENILLCERGTSFGYNTLVNDMRSLPIMAQTGYPVVYDATHSVQQPAGKGDSTGGDRTMVPYLSRAAIAIGVAGIFIETHENPDGAPSDGPNMVRLEDMPQLLQSLKQIDNLVKGL